MATTQAEHQQETVFIVDDEDGVRIGLERILDANGYATESFDSAEEFLARLPRCRAGCVLLDIQMPGLSGMKLQAQLVEQDFPLPIIFLTAKGDVPSSVTAMKLGAEDFLPKLAGEEPILEAVGRAMERCKASTRERDVREEAKKRAATLTGRELEVCSHVIAGSLNKQTAYHLGISERTVKAHRTKVMEKMGVLSVADLVRIAAAAGIPVSPTSL